MELKGQCLGANRGPVTEHRCHFDPKDLGRKQKAESERWSHRHRQLLLNK